MITTALLDLDGTLIDSNDAHAKAWVETLEEFGHRVAFRDARSAIGKGADHFLPDVVGVAAGSRDAKRIIERRSTVFKERYLATLQPFPHARDLLEHMHALGLRLVTATSANPDEVEVVLGILGVTHLMHDKASAGDAKRSKPDADIVSAALRKAGCTTSEAVMLGDTPYDIEAAKKARVEIVAFRCGGWSDHDLRGATAIFDNPGRLLADFESSPFRGRRIP